MIQSTSGNYTLLLIQGDTQETLKINGRLKNKRKRNNNNKKAT